MTSSASRFVKLFVLGAVVLTAVDALVPPTAFQSQQRLTTTSCWSFVVPCPTSKATTTTTRLFMAEPEGNKNSVETENEQAEVKTSEENTVVAEETAAEEEEEEKEDPEVTALKQEIFNLESELKAKRRQVNDVTDRADEYSKTGYARKVAEMENMRRARSMMQSSDRSAALASVLTEFLPVWDQLVVLQKQWQDDAFGKQYAALATNMETAFTELGVTSFTVPPGEKVDPTRMIVLESEHSEFVPANIVLRPVRMGIELQGNILRFAEVVASLGPEAPAAEEKDEAAAAESASDEGEEEPSEAETKAE